MCGRLIHPNGIYTLTSKTYDILLIHPNGIYTLTSKTYDIYENYNCIYL